VFVSAIIAGILTAIIEINQLSILKEIQALLGIYLLFFPVGFLFIQALFFSSKKPLFIERILLSAVISIPLIVLPLLAGWGIARVPFNFLNTLLIIEALCIIFYAAFLLQKRRLGP